MNSKKLLPLFVFILLLTPVVTLAQFEPLVGIPGITDPNADFNDYINTLYAISISVAGLVAVIKIIIAGVKWMLSDLVSSKQEAKSDIQGALIGLLIIISAVLILEVINPQLTQSRLFLDPVDRPSGSGSGSTATAAPTAPLPPPVLPSSKEPIKCTLVAGKWDCSAAEAACSAKKGKVETSWLSSPNVITCVLGNVKNTDCPEVIDPSTLQPVGRCDSAFITKICPSPTSTATLINNNETVSCYTPY
jgi:hypothetical protein